MTRWLIRPAPEPDEVFSSWLHRCALANGVGNHVLCSRMFGNSDIWSRDIDRSFPIALTRNLKQHLGIEPSAVKQLLLTSYAGRIAQKVRDNTNSVWITPLGVYHRTHRVHGQQFCPLCLREWPVYFRKIWRLGFITVCPVHHIALHDACPGCDGPVTLHRLIISRVIGPRCDVCGTALTTGAIQPAMRSLCQWTDRLIDTMKTKRYVLNDRTISAVAFFRGLRILAMGLVTVKTRVNLKVRAIEMLIDQYPVPTQAMIERHRVAVRYVCMIRLHEWLSDWPDIIRHDIENAGLQPSRLSADVENPPQWLMQGVRHRREPWKRRVNHRR
jgi:hypothetical protein